MKVRYGAYTHEDDEASISISVDPVYNEAGEPVELRERWDISGLLQASSVSALTAKIDALVLAYRVNGRDLMLLTDEGTQTSHLINSALTTGGTRVVKLPSFPVGTGAEYSTFRTYSLAVEAMRVVTGSESLLKWEQTLTLSGGGPRFVHLQTLVGAPQKQFTAQSTPYRATQTGSAVGHLSYPIPAAPLFPNSEQRDKRTIRRSSPKRTGRGAYLRYHEYPVDWSYSFESAAVLDGVPGVWVPQ